MAEEVRISVSPIDEVSRIYTPHNIAEQTQVSGFAFSRRLFRKTNLSRKHILPAFFEGTQPFEYAELSRQLASDSAGGATVGENSISIWISDDHWKEGSETNHIWVYFGPEKRLTLWAPGGFPAGFAGVADLNSAADWLEDQVKTDHWDEIALVTSATDGMKIDRIRIRHSSQTILDWECGLWLDASKVGGNDKLVLTAKILEAKLSQVGNVWVPQIHWAAREIGKTDGSKYGTSGAWCSEFASWCLRRGMWDTPEGSIGSQAMEDYFDSLGRMYTHDQLLDGVYRLVAGDYVRFQWSSGGQHSAIFMEYIDDPSVPTDATRIRTIEGNGSSTVLVTTRKLQHILSIGNCQ